jgi:hypothetical protein
MRHAFVLCLGVVACGGGSTTPRDAPGALDAPGASDAPADAACAADLHLGSAGGGAFGYGQHYPNGAAAVAYAYGPDGTWKAMSPLVYATNYYQACATSAHPYDRSALIAYADGTHFATAGDANCHLLCDGNHDGNVDQPDCGHAFHEHAGKGVGGAATGTPFTVFWFDDNWLARYMSQAYAMPLPDGLSDYTDFTRWRILGGDRTNWTPYGSSEFDTLALDGLYALAGGDVAGAQSKWNAILTKSNASYDDATQRFLYPAIAENYHMGLFKILTDQLMGDPGVDTATRLLLVQHSEALRSNILDQQEHAASGPIGWRSDRTQTGSLINIESIAVEVLALGARATAVFEPGVPPMTADPNGYFVRPYHAISAVAGTSTAGMLARGPRIQAPPGSYIATFMVRVPQPSGAAPIATLDVYDAISGTVLASRDVIAADLATSNQWTALAVAVTAPAGCNALELRLHWAGTTNLDLGSIRFR